MGAGCAGGRSLSAMDGANPSLRAMSPLYGGFVVYGSWVKSLNGGVRQIGRIADLGALIDIDWRYYFSDLRNFHPNQVTRRHTWGMVLRVAAVVIV